MGVWLPHATGTSGTVGALEGGCGGDGTAGALGGALQPKTSRSESAQSATKRIFAFMAPLSRADFKYMADIGL